MRKAIYFYIVLLFFCACNAHREVIVESVDTTNTIKLYKHQTLEKAFVVDIPMGVLIKNKSFGELRLSHIRYSHNGSIPEGVKILKENTDTYNIFLQEEYISGKKERKYIIIPRFGLKLSDVDDNSQQVKNLLNKLEQSSQQDTISLESLPLFKEKYPMVMDKLINNDSLYIYFDLGEKGYEIVKHPVEY